LTIHRIEFYLVSLYKCGLTIVLLKKHLIFIGVHHITSTTLNHICKIQVQAPYIYQY